VERLIEDIERSAEEAQHEIRLLSYLLYPPQLEHDGARRTIEHYVEGFARRAHLDVTHRVTDAVDELPLDLQRSVLRIIQEAMANVHRHAARAAAAIQRNAADRELAGGHRAEGAHPVGCCAEDVEPYRARFPRVAVAVRGEQACLVEATASEGSSRIPSHICGFSRMAARAQPTSSWHASKEDPMRYISTAVLALSVALVASAAQAQSTQKSKKTQMTQQQQIAERQKCFEEAQAAVPGFAIGGGEGNQRTAAYMSCAQRKGIRP
jgi:hypothetical protein